MAFEPYEQFKQRAMERDVRMGLGLAPDSVYQLQYEDYVLGGPNHKEINVDLRTQKPVLSSSQDQKKTNYIIPPQNQQQPKTEGEQAYDRLKKFFGGIIADPNWIQNTPAFNTYGGR